MILLTLTACGVGSPNSEAPRITDRPAVTVAVSNGDWSSRDAYIDDMEDSLTKVANILGQTQEWSYDCGNGVYLYMECVVLFVTAMDTIDTHIEYFEGTTPPSGFERAQSLALQAWEKWRQSFAQMAEGFREAASGDMDGAIGYINSAASLTHEGTSLIERARLALPSN